MLKKKNISTPLDSINLNSEFNRPERFDPDLPPLGGFDVMNRLILFQRRQVAIQRKLKGDR